MNHTIEQLYDHWHRKTGDASAAATLVLASIQAGGQPPNTNGAMSVLAAAAQLGVSKETIYKLCHENALPHSRIGRRITISQEQLAEYQNRPRVLSVGFRHLRPPSAA